MLYSLELVLWFTCNFDLDTSAILMAVFHGVMLTILLSKGFPKYDNVNVADLFVAISYVLHLGITTLACIMVPLHAWVIGLGLTYVTRTVITRPDQPPITNFFIELVAAAVISFCPLDRWWCITLFQASDISLFYHTHYWYHGNKRHDAHTTAVTAWFIACIIMAIQLYTIGTA